MCDGAFQSKGLIFGTDSFTKKDVVKLMNVLLIKYNINSTYHVSKELPRIYILRKEVYKIYIIVNEYIIPSSKYKLTGIR